MLLFPESGPKKKLSGNGFTKNRDPGIRSATPEFGSKKDFRVTASLKP
jgi:hypothetical protein